MNIPPVSFYSGAIGAWIVGTCIETVVWSCFLGTERGNSSWPFIFSWMTFLQGISTLFSIGVMNRIFGWFAPFPFHTTYYYTTLLIDPFGLAISFLLLPLLLEAALWYILGPLLFPERMGNSQVSKGISLRIALEGSTLANGLTFLLGIVILSLAPVTVIWTNFWMGGGWLLFIPFALLAVCSLILWFRR